MRNTSSLIALAVAALASNAIAQNDDCAGALPIVLGANGPFTNVGSTTSAPAWPCAAGANDIWFVFTAAAAGTLILDTCTGTNYDSCIQVFDGAGGCGGLTSLGCNDDFCGLQSTLTVQVNAGPCYIRVGGFAGSTGTFTLNVGFGTVSATNTSVGAGCVSVAAAFYESFATSAAFDLSNTAISMLPSGNDYVVLQGAATFVAPSATATIVTLFDDDEAPVTLTSAFPYPGGATTSLTVCSNGYVSVASGNGTSFSPFVPTFLDAPQTGWWNWHDYNPSILASGKVKFEQVGAIAYITWDGVWDYAATSAASANTFQFQFDTSSGAVHLVFQTMSTGGNARLVGFSGGGATADPGGVDLSAVLPASFVVRGIDVQPLALAASSRPVTGTSWNLDVSNVPAAATIGIEIFGVANPNIPDLAFLGAPGCGSFASLDVLNVWVVAAQPTHSYSLAIPANPALVNFHVFTQAVALVPGINALLGGTITSNGIDGMLGDY